MTTHFLFLLLLLHLHLFLREPVLLAASSQPPALETETLNFPTFHDNDENKTFFTYGNASVNQGALQLTPDSSNTDVIFHQNASGRVFLPGAFRLWDNDSASTIVASFNTSFVTNMDRINNNSNTGEGFTFLISSHLEPPPPGSYGGFLGLTNKTIDGNLSNHLVALEFDTSKQGYDPNSNHVGLNINSIVPIVNNSLDQYGINLSPVKSTNHHVWIDYDGRSRRVRVYITNDSASIDKPKSPVLDYSLDLSKHLLKDNFLGFSASTGVKFQLHCIREWNLTMEIIPVEGDDKMVRLGITIGAPIFALVIAIILVFAWYMSRGKARLRKEASLVDRLKSLPGMPREFNYNELKKATGNFRKSNELGRGGFGVVYKGTIECDGETEEVAVKMFSKESSKDEDFFKELTIINRLRHRHLVRLFGWCYRRGMLLLVYEYMPEGSLDSHLHKAPLDCVLPWASRYNILVHVASALDYLHNDYELKIVHRDIKTSNILLDSNFDARLGDFGLAKAIEPSRTSYTTFEPAGTRGYIAPECFITGKATVESDMFAFGTVMLEVICCRRPLSGGEGGGLLLDWVWMLYREGRILEAVDVRLSGTYDEAEAERLLLLGLACCHSVHTDRPKTETIVQMLNGSLPVPHVPPFRPPLPFPAVPLGDGSIISESSSTLPTCSLTGR